MAEAVFDLRDPYRATLHQRYYCDLSLRDIARNAGVPVETVRTRLRRALAILRARLDAEFDGDRRRWCALLAPLCPSPTNVLAAVIMTTPLKIASAAAVVALLVLLVASVAWSGGGPRALPPEPTFDASVEPMLATSDEGLAVLAGSGGERREVEATAVADEEVRYDGRLVVVEGGVEYEGRSGSFELVSERQGEPPVRRQIEVVAGRFYVTVDSRAKLSTGRVVVEGKPAEIDRKPVTSENGVTLYVRLGASPQEAPAAGPGLVLRVVDAATGADLDGVTVLERMDRIRDNEHPGDLRDFREHVRGGSSPVTVHSRRQSSLWVHAPGYAWRQAFVDLAAGGTRTVELEPGGGAGRDHHRGLAAGRGLGAGTEAGSRGLPVRGREGARGRRFDARGRPAAR